MRTDTGFSSPVVSLRHSTWAISSTVTVTQVKSNMTCPAAAEMLGAAEATGCAACSLPIMGRMTYAWLIISAW